MQPSVYTTENDFDYSAIGNELGVNQAASAQSIVQGRDEIEAGQYRQEEPRIPHVSDFQYDAPESEGESLEEERAHPIHIEIHPPAS